ncbi:MAG: DUF2946 family protein [Rhizomicrobium sp.]
MARTIKFAGLHLALAAMMLRALLPVGWMPNPSMAGGTPLTICTMNGPVQMVLGPDGQPQKPKPHQGNANHHDTCPFAAAPHFATTTPPIALGPAVIRVSLAPAALRPLAIWTTQQHSLQSPRAPPRLV